MYDFFSPGLMFSRIVEIKTKKLSVVLVEVFNLIRDESDGYIVKIEEKVIFMIILVDKEIHEISLEDTVEIYFFQSSVGNFTVPLQIVLLLNVTNVGLNKIAELLLVFAEYVPAILQFRQQEFRYFDIDLVDSDITHKFIVQLTITWREH